MKVYVFYSTKEPIGNDPETLEGASIVWEAVKEDSQYSCDHQIWHHSLEELKDSVYKLWGETEFIQIPEKVLTSSQWYQNKSMNSWEEGQSDLMKRLELSHSMLDSSDWWEKYSNFLKTI
jgi:hypothetical protein